MAQISMKLFVILAIFIPLAAAEQYVTGYSDLQCQVPVSTISCSQAWNNCVGFGGWINSFLITKDDNSQCNPLRGLWDFFQLSFGCDDNGSARGYGCGIPSNCQQTINCNDEGTDCSDAPGDAVTCTETW